MQNSRFRLLFHFKSSRGITIFEIERLDIPKTSPPAERFQWFFYDGTREQLTALTFESLGKSGIESQWRQFKQGKLTFDHQKAYFDEFELTHSRELLQANVQQLVEKFFLI